MGKLLNLLLGSAWSYVAGATLIAMALGGIYAKGHHDGTRSTELSYIQKEAKLAEQAAQAERAARALDAAAAKEAAEQAYDLKQRIAQLNAQIKDADRVCLDSDDTDGLRNLWDH